MRQVSRTIARHSVFSIQTRRRFLPVRASDDSHLVGDRTGRAPIGRVNDTWRATREQPVRDRSCKARGSPSRITRAPTRARCFSRRCLVNGYVTVNFIAGDCGDVTDGDTDVNRRDDQSVSRRNRLLPLTSTSTLVRFASIDANRVEIMCRLNDGSFSYPPSIRISFGTI